MDAISTKYATLLLLITLLVGCSNSVNNYNNALLEYEHKIELCREQRSEPFTDKKPLEVSDEDIRSALSYFIVKTFEDCSEAERLVLISALDEIVEDRQAAVLIRYNAKNLLESLSDDQQMLQAEYEKFMALAPSIQEKLVKIQAYSRPFDPLMALENYIGEDQ